MGSTNTRTLEKNILESTEKLIQCAAAASKLEGEAKARELKRSTEIVYAIASDLRHLIDVKDEYLPGILSQLVSQKLPEADIQTGDESLGEELEYILKLGTMALVEKAREDYNQVGHGYDLLEKSFQAKTSGSEDELGKSNRGVGMEAYIAELEHETFFADLEVEVSNGIPEINLLPAECRMQEEPCAKEVLAPVAGPTEKCLTRGLELSLRTVFPGEVIETHWRLEDVEFAFYLPQIGLACDNEVEQGELSRKQELCSGKGLKYLSISVEDSKNPRRVRRLVKWSGKLT